MTKLARKSVFIVLIVIFSVSAVFADPVFKDTSVNIPVKYKAGSNKHKATFILSTTDVNAPMPEGSSNRKKTVIMHGSGDVDFGEMVFTKPDAFMYSIDRKEKGKNIDSTHYDVFVAVLFDMKKVLVIKKEGSKHKPDKILYKDKKKSKAPGPKTGDVRTMIPYILCFMMLLAAMLLIISSKRNYDKPFKELLKIARKRQE